MHVVVEGVACERLAQRHQAQSLADNRNCAQSECALRRPHHIDGADMAAIDRGRGGDNVGDSQLAEPYEVGYGGQILASIGIEAAEAASS